MMGGAAAAAAIGTAVYMMNHKKPSNMRKMRRGAAKTMKTVGSIANGISTMMR